MMPSYVEGQSEKSSINLENSFYSIGSRPPPCSPQYPEHSLAPNPAMKRAHLCERVPIKFTSSSNRIVPNAYHRPFL